MDLIALVVAGQRIHHQIHAEADRHLALASSARHGIDDGLSARIDGPRAGTAKIVIAWRFTDTKEVLVSTLSHGALTWSAGKATPQADASVTTTRAALEPVILGQKTLADAGIAASGNAKALPDLWALLADFKSGIPVIEPR